MVHSNIAQNRGAHVSAPEHVLTPRVARSHFLPPQTARSGFVAKSKLTSIRVPTCAASIVSTKRVMDHSPTFELSPAERRDIPRLAHIHVVAFLPDNAFRLYFATPTEFEKRVTEMLEGQVGDLTWQHVKAVDKKTGVLAAWASWNTPTDAQIQERDGTAAAKILDSDKVTGKGECEFPPGLPIYVQEDTDRWLENWTRGKRHMLCKALFTEPSFQRQGMGNALVD